MADGSIVLTTEIDDSGIKKGMGNLKNAAKSFGFAFAAAGAAATSAIVAVGAAAIKSYAQYEQLVGGVETLFKESSDTVLQYADRAYETAGMSANAYMETITSFSASLLQSLGGDTAKAAEMGNQAIVDMSDNANKMGTDMQRIQDAYQGFAKQNYTMLDNLKLGYGGTKTEMERLLKDAENIKKANGEMADYSIDKFSDIVEAIHVVQENMGIAGTTAKEASTTIEGSVKAMQAAWQNLVVGLSRDDADIADLTKKFVESFETVFKNLMPVIEKVIGNMPNMLKNLIDALSRILPQLSRQVGSLAVMVVQTLIKSIPEILRAGAEIGKSLVSGITSALSELSPALTAAVTAVIGAFAALQTMNLVSGLVSSLTAAMSVVKEFQIVMQASAGAGMLFASSLTPLEMLLGVLTGQISLATAAQAAFNVVASMNPFVLLVAGVGAFIGALVGLNAAMDAQIEKNSELVAHTHELKSAAEEAQTAMQSLSDEMTQASERSNENILNIEAEAYANQTLADELFNIAEKQEKTNAEKERMAQIVETLNGSVQGLNLELNNETGELNKTRDAVQELIQQKMELARADAVQSLYTEQLKNQYKAQVNAATAARQYSDAQSELNSILANGEKVTIRRQGAEVTYTRYTREQQKAMKDLRAAMSEYQNTITGAQTSIQNSTASLQTLANVAGVTLPADFSAAQDSTQGFFDALSSQMSDASSSASTEGTNFGTGYVNGINSQSGAAYQAGYNLGLQALAGTRAAQLSGSPARKLIEEGKFFGQGYEIGIDGERKNTYKSGQGLAISAIDGIKNYLTTAKTEISKFVKGVYSAYEKAVTDSRSNLQKLYDEENQKQLDSEIWYEAERKRIESERDENDYQERLKEARDSEAKQRIIDERNKELRRRAEDEYLKDLEETARKERRIYEARQRDAEENAKKIVDAYIAAGKKYEEAVDAVIDHYSSAANEAQRSLQELQETQEKYAKDLLKSVKVFEDDATNRFANFTELTTQKTVRGVNRKRLTNLDEKTRELRNYADALLELKNREDVPNELFEEVRGMSYDKAILFLDRLSELGDKDFSKYIESYKEYKKTQIELSEQIYEPNEKEPRVLADINAQTEAIEEYYAALETLRTRGKVPKDFFAFLRDMSMSDGLEYANALLSLTDSEFAEYINSWERQQSTAKEISKRLYKNEADELTYEVHEKFKKVEQEFLEVGKNSAAQFQDGFLQQFKNVANTIKETVSDAFTDIMPQMQFAGAASIPVPAMATGGIVPRATLAMVGERGREAVLPLENNTGWMDTLAAKIRGGNATTVILQVGEREFGRAVVDLGGAESRVQGVSLIK